MSLMMSPNDEDLVEQAIKDELGSETFNVSKKHFTNFMIAGNFAKYARFYIFRRFFAGIYPPDQLKTDKTQRST